MTSVYDQDKWIASFIERMTTCVNDFAGWSITKRQSKQRYSIKDEAGVVLFKVDITKAQNVIDKYVTITIRNWITDEWVKFKMKLKADFDYNTLKRKFVGNVNNLLRKQCLKMSQYLYEYEDYSSYLVGLLDLSLNRKCIEDTNKEAPHLYISWCIGKMLKNGGYNFSPGVLQTDTGYCIYFADYDANKHMTLDIDYDFFGGSVRLRYKSQLYNKYYNTEFYKLFDIMDFYKFVIKQNLPFLSGDSWKKVVNEDTICSMYPEAVNNTEKLLLFCDGL
jgi:hypothetical protein